MRARSARRGGRSPRPSASGAWSTAARRGRGRWARLGSAETGFVGFPATPRPSARWRDIALDRSQRTIRLPAGVRLDLGGSAKGLAVDLAGELLSRHANYAVDAGGDIRIGGTHPIARTVHIRHPLDDEIAHSFAMATGAVATSGLQTRLWRTERGFAHHLLARHGGALILDDGSLVLAGDLAVTSTPAAA